MDPLGIQALVAPIIAEAVAEIRDALAAPKLPQPYLSQAKLAVVLDVCNQTITNMVKRGCPCFWVGETRRFDLAEVRAWLATQKSEADR